MRLTSPINPERLGAVPLPSGTRTMNLEPMMAGLARAATPRPALSLANVKISQYSRNFAISLGYGPFLDLSTDVKANVYLVEFIATTAEIAMPNEPDIAVTMGVGVRLVLATDQISGTGVGNLAGISAKTTIEAVQHRVYAQSLGLPEPFAGAFVGAFPPTTTFNIDTLSTFGTEITKVAETMVRLAREDASALTLRMIEIVEYLPESYSILGVARSNGYALHRITAGDSLDEALDRLGNRIEARNDNYPYAKVDPVAVRIVYDRIVGASAGRPSDAQKQVAERIQRLGR